MYQQQQLSVIYIPYSPEPCGIGMGWDVLSYVISPSVSLVVWLRGGFEGTSSFQLCRPSQAANKQSIHPSIHPTASSTSIKLHWKSASPTKRTLTPFRSPYYRPLSVTNTAAVAHAKEQYRQDDKEKEDEPGGQRASST